MQDLLLVQTPVVVQTYLDNPYLIEGLKFDLRLYVLLYGVNPLKIYLFEEGLARFATTEYMSAKESDLTDVFMHLTNYSINKHAANFVSSEIGKSHKRNLKQIYEHLAKHGHNVEGLKSQISELIIKAIIPGQNYLD